MSVEAAATAVETYDTYVHNKKSWRLRTLLGRSVAVFLFRKHAQL